MKYYRTCMDLNSKGLILFPLLPILHCYLYYYALFLVIPLIVITALLGLLDLYLHIYF